MKFARYLGQGLAWAALAVFVGLLGQGPSFAPFGPDKALVKLSMAHLPERLQPCRELTAAERAELPPTRRVERVCKRGRAPTRFELFLDDRLVARETVAPAGLSDDGRSYYLAYFTVDPGRYTATVRLADTPRAEGFDLERRLSLQLRAGESALIEIGDDGVVLAGREEENVR